MSPSIKLGECRTLLDEREWAAKFFGNFAEFEQSQNRCCRHHMTGKQRVATAVFSQCHHKKMVLHRCFVLINTPAAFWTLFLMLAICLLHHLQLHTCACAASQRLHAHILQQSRGRNVCVHLDVNVLYVHHIACANNLRPSMGGTYKCHFLYVKALLCNFYSDDITSMTDWHRLTTNSVGLTREHD